MPVIVALRARGLEERHFKEMSVKLGGVNIDPINLTMADLKKLGLTEGSSLDVIRSVADVAMREDNVRGAIDSLELELVNMKADIM